MAALLGVMCRMQVRTSVCVPLLPWHKPFGGAAHQWCCPRSSGAVMSVALPSLVGQAAVMCMSAT